ncbi:MAG: hypothetical protein PHW08_01910 [Kiritimatiellae bacterium]|nr:hypothetical protein [Kiritimatiellia bacterium]
MNVLAQQGFGPKDKLTRGLEQGCISGVVFSPRYLSPDRMRETIVQLRGAGRQLLMDPEFFATAYLRHPQPNLGTLEQWDYFQPPRRAGLISGSLIPEIIQHCVQTQAGMGLGEWIAPSVYVRAADSMDSGIALNFAAHARRAADAVGKGVVFATLAVDRDVFLNGPGFRDIVDALTAIDDPPDGYYILVGSGESRASNNQLRSDIYHPEVIAGLMYANYALSINGARIINGYCHLLGPLMGACGAEAASSGWFSGLRRFSMNKYVKDESGGRAPVIRYVSTPLLSRIRQSDFLAYQSILPEVASNTPSDSLYSREEPSRTDEALQSWEAVQTLSRVCISGNIPGDIEKFKQRVIRASELWFALQETGFSQDVEPNLERLTAIRDGITLFEKLAELA